MAIERGGQRRCVSGVDEEGMGAEDAVPVNSEELVQQRQQVTATSPVLLFAMLHRCYLPTPV